MLLIMFERLQNIPTVAKLTSHTLPGNSDAIWQSVSSTPSSAIPPTIV
jgi:hypothetical protein